MTDAGESRKPADEGLTPEERRMLETLAAGGAGRPPATPARPEAGRTSVSDVVTEEEARILDQARRESERLSRTSIRQMFERDASSTTPEGLEALLAPPPEDDETPPEPSAFERSLFGRALASCLEVANAPFRWLPPAVRLGLGLGGVLLLITLLVVILVRLLPL
jgi:hypothetical protein